jgi:hypothetical protein
MLQDGHSFILPQVFGDSVERLRQVLRHPESYVAVSAEQSANAARLMVVIDIWHAERGLTDCAGVGLCGPHAFNVFWRHPEVLSPAIVSSPLLLAFRVGHLPNFGSRLMESRIFAITCFPFG